MSENKLILNEKTKLLTEDVLDYLDKNSNPLDIMYSYYECAIMEVETKFNVLNRQLSVYYDHNPIESISSRIKSKNSLVRKMLKLNVKLDIPDIMENINDIAGVRVVCSFVEDIYELEKSFLSQDDVKLIQRKDYIANPKESGYRSLHLIVEVPIFLKDEKKMMRVEVQMRTIAMDFWASLEHKIRYKKNLQEADLLEISNDLKDCAEQAHQLDMKMQDIHAKIVNAKHSAPPNSFSEIIKNRLSNRAKG
ncbi:MAG: GTP pyrophosphokinase family protein [Erysipelotrichaceae bacterium]|nr:GTP pyrophosphokinase family protein [Erysipelotrichaceae bacterium]